MHQPTYIFRFSEPTKDDTAEQYTICKVDCSDRGTDIYYQLHKDENRPNWVFIGNFPSHTSNEIILEQINARFNE